MIFENHLFSYNRDKIWYIADPLNKYNKSRFYANILENPENRNNSQCMGIIAAKFRRVMSKYPYTRYRQKST